MKKIISIPKTKNRNKKKRKERDAALTFQECLKRSKLKKRRSSKELSQIETINQMDLHQLTRKKKKSKFNGNQILHDLIEAAVNSHTICDIKFTDKQIMIIAS